MKTFVPFVLILALPSAPAAASSDAAELWLNSLVSFGIAKNTGIELETAQRLCGADARWMFKTDAEMFLTLQGTRNASDSGLNGLTTQMSVICDITPRITLSAAYLRQQDFNNRAPDVADHAPIVGIEFSFKTQPSMPLAT